MRSLILAASIGLAYLLLRGWPEQFTLLLRGCLAVLALVLGFGLWRRHEKPAGSHATAIRAPRWNDYLALGIGVLAIECVFLFMLTVLPPKAEDMALSLEATLRPEAAAQRRARAADRDGPAGRTSGNWLWDSQGHRPLPVRTAARPSAKPEVFFRADDRTNADRFVRWRAYVRAFALERYDSATCFLVPIPAESLSANSLGYITFPQPDTRPGPVISGEIFHSIHPDGQDVLTAPQGLVSVELQAVRRIAPGIFRLKPRPTGSSGYNYRTRSRPLTLESLTIGNRALNLQPARDAPEHLLALPTDPELRGQLFQIAVRTQGPIESRMLALRTFLAETCRYSLSVDNEQGLDPIDNFLFHERRGHCEFFATAATLLCRALGIPARIAYGWSGGRHYEAQDLIMFRAKEAHAWTEVLLEDYGWVVFDTTPADALEAAAATVAPAGEDPPLGEDGIIEEDPATEDLSARWSWTALAVGGALLPVTLLILILRRKPRPDVRPEAQLLLPDPPGYLSRFRNACRQLGHPMPAGRTLRQHLAHLAARDLAPPCANELLDYHYDTTYGAASPDPAREKSLAGAIAAWR